ncbi:MAG: 6-carboxytetrahydropterin synthase QueD [Eggerthellaceae bacterium]|nr:6-carboxytetrahydropterin synthase QueD [Eggerthellaceae bacterium]
MIKAVLYTDGGSRGNPGLAGLGFELAAEDGTPIAQGGWCLAHATNNIAEYSALIWGLLNARAAEVTHLTVRADSELMVKQINGAYRVRSEELKPLYLQAKSLLAGFSAYKAEHVRREENKAADSLVNAAMDKRAATGAYLVPWEEFPQSLFDKDGQSGNDGRGEGSDNGMGGQKGSPGDDESLERVDAMERNKAYTGPGKLSGSDFEEMGGTYGLTVRDHFDAAHTLPGYDGPCRFLHGHTWDVEASITGQELDPVGMIYDFKDLKNSLHAVLDNFDHRYINDVPPFDEINPTAENLARVVYYELEKTLPKGILLHDITVWESPQAKIVYRP